MQTGTKVLLGLLGAMGAGIAARALSGDGSPLSATFGALPEVPNGTEFTVTITVTNTGDATARGVHIAMNVSDSGGNPIISTYSTDIGDIAPGKTVEVTETFGFSKVLTGTATYHLVVSAENLSEEQYVDKKGDAFKVIPPPTPSLTASAEFAA